MSSISVLLVAWVALASLGWVGYAAWGAYHLWTVESLEDWVGPTPQSWPTVSIIVPACNEADRLEAAMQSLLALDYPNLEIILVEDRSTDETPAIADRMADDDSRLEVVHIEELPEGWLGKVHALHRGVERASGDWYLFTDADIHYEPDLLRRAIRAALHRQADHVTLVPEMRATGFWHEALVMAFVTAFIAINPRATDREETDDFVGIGAFNLVRRSAFEETEGFEWLRMEIADDAGLGLLLNRHGGRSLFGLAGDGLALDVYDSFGDALAGFEKNAFPIMAGYSWLRVLVGLAVCLVGVAGPIIGLVWLGLGAWPFSLAAVGALVALALVGADVLERSPWPFLVTPVAQLCLVYGVLRSAILCTSRGAVERRGTRYPLEKLRQLQRVEM
ncbi:MAG: glycosyltransferase family 2 protein [Bradymonadaceae bacterium]